MTLLLLNPGLGNLGSIESSLDLLGIEYDLINQFDHGLDFSKYKNFILPGVGSFPFGMKKLRETGLDKLVYYLNEKKVKGLGICLGMQILMEYGTESSNGKVKGLGLLKGDVTLLDSSNGLVPNVGWCATKFKKSIDKYHHKNINIDYYYTHSYYVKPKESKNIFLTSKHGNKEFVAGLWHENLYGIQFHPEKSHDDGLRLLKAIIYRK